jgi:hypothetical protein
MRSKPNWESKLKKTLIIMVVSHPLALNQRATSIASPLPAHIILTSMHNRTDIKLETLTL